MRAIELSEPVVVLPHDADASLCKKAFEQGERQVLVGSRVVEDIALATGDGEGREIPVVHPDASLESVLDSLLGETLLQIQRLDPQEPRLVTERAIVREAAHLLPQDWKVETQELIAVKGDATRQQALDAMTTAGVRHLVLLDSTGKWMGVLSLRDLALASPKVEVAAEMQSRVGTFWVSPDSSLRDACRLMAERDVGCVPVIDKGDCVGIVTRTDILAALRRATVVS